MFGPFSTQIPPKTPHQRRQRAGDAFLGCPRWCLTLIPSKEPSNGDKGAANSGKPRLRSSPRRCCRVLRRTSVWPRELWLGRHASSDPRQAERCQAFEEERGTGEGDQNENLEKRKENKHSCGRGGAQVASGRSSSLVLLLLFYPPCSQNLLRSAGFCEVTHKGQQDSRGWVGGGADLVQAALTTWLIARISRKTTEPPRLLAFTADCGEPGWRLAEVQPPSTSQTRNN